MTQRVLPYKVPSPGVVSVSEWNLVLNDERVPLPEALPDWDYQMNLSLERMVEIDLDRARSEAGLPPGAVLNLSVVWTATGSNLRAPAARHRLQGPGVRTIELSPHLQGSELGGLLHLDTVLVLAEPIPQGNPTAPRRAGSVLWSDRRSLRLQGDAPQFPMAVIDFAMTSFPENAAFHLQIGSDLLSAAMGSLLLIINEKNEAASTAFQNAAKPRPIDKAILSAIRTDAARIMIEHALRHPEFSAEATFPEETLGATLMALINTLFPNDSVNDLRLRLGAPNLAGSDIQAATKIFKDV